MQKSPPKEAVVMGGGAAGIGAALALADLGWLITLIEEKWLCAGATGNNPGRMGHGLHYKDLETALLYLHASYGVQRKYPGYLVGQGEQYGRGRYYITKNSTVPKEEVLKTYNRLAQEYALLVSKAEEEEYTLLGIKKGENAEIDKQVYEKCAVFGPPELFMRILDPAEYSPHINPDHVEIAIESAEHIFNWPQFAKDIRTTLENHPNITLLEHTKVEQISRGQPGEERFVLHLKSNNTSNGLAELKSNFVVNSTWHNIEALNSQLGLQMIPSSRTSRLKVLAKVKLPPSLCAENSAFFCFCNGAMFSNMGDGYGMLTYADVTNVDLTYGTQLTPEIARFYNDEVSLEEKEELCRKIIAGVSKYIPEMADAEPVELKFGIVRTDGVVTLDNLHDPSGPLGIRNYHSIDPDQQGWISNPAIKLFYFLQNGEIVSKLLEDQYQIAPMIEEYYENLLAKAKESNIELIPDLQQAFAINLDLYTPSELEAAKKFLKNDDYIVTLRQKINVNKAIIASRRQPSVVLLDEMISSKRHEDLSSDSEDLTDSEEDDRINNAAMINQRILKLQQQIAKIKLKPAEDQVDSYHNRQELNKLQCKLDELINTLNAIQNVMQQETTVEVVQNNSLTSNQNNEELTDDSTDRTSSNSSSPNLPLYAKNETIDNRREKSDSYSTIQSIYNFFTTFPSIYPKKHRIQPTNTLLNINLSKP